MNRLRSRASAYREPKAILYTDYYSFIGGGQQNLLSVFRGLDRRSWTPHLVLPAEGPFAAEARALKVQVHISPMGKARWRLPWQAYPAMRRLRSLMASVNAALVHCNDYPSFKLAAPAAHGLGLRVLYHQQIAVTQKPGSSTGWLMRWHLAQADRILAVSKNSLEALAALGLDRSKLGLLYNNADTVALARAKPLPGSGPLVLAAGMRRPHKGFEVLLQAWRQVKKGQLVLLGDVAHAESGHEAQLLALQSGLPRFKALPAQRPLAPWLKRATLFVSSSRWEGSPLVVLEAMAAGTPVLATHEASGEIIEHGRTGWLVKAGDPQALAGAIQELLSEPALRRRLGQAGQREVQRRFSLKAYMQALHSHYAELAA